MGMIDIFRDYMNSLIGQPREFERLLADRDISAVKERMANRRPLIAEAMREYDTYSHEIMNRRDKIVKGRNGLVKRVEKVWKLPIPYPVYINEIALVFLYGRPVKWSQQSDGTDKAFEAFQNVIKGTRFNSKIRQCKRVAGAETESAMLFRVYKDGDGKADVQIRVLAASKGDEIYVKWDQYENIISIAWGYYLCEEKDSKAYHFDIFTKDTVYRCVKRSLGWDVTEETNLIGKIPVILFQQEKEWAGVEHLIHREEFIASRTADTNDYYADPMLVLSADMVKNMPEKKEEAKVLVTRDSEGVDKAAKFLTWDSAPQSKKDEIEWLQEQILSQTFTPKISLDTLKSISQLSAKALRTVMMLADIKAARRKETHDELLDRTASLVKAIIGNVLDVSLKGECERLVVAHEYQEPFGEDVEDAIKNIIQVVDAGIMSTESALEQNPLVKDVALEKKRLQEEREDSQRRQMDLFGDVEGAGARSAFSGETNPGGRNDGGNRP